MIAAAGHGPAVDVDAHPAATSRSRRDASDRTDVFAALVGELPVGLLQRRTLVRLVGVTPSTLRPRGAVQGQLFAALDTLCARHGFRLRTPSLTK